MKTVAHEGPESETSPHLAWKLYAAPSSRIASMCGVSDHRSASGRQPSIAMTSVFRGVSLPLQGLLVAWALRASGAVRVR